MKKIIALFAVFACFNLHAQTIQMLHPATGHNPITDTIVNTNTDTAFVQVSHVWTNISIQVIIKPIGSNLWNSTSKIYGSLDGIHYLQIGSTSFATDSVINTTKSYVWNLTTDEYLYYMVQTVGTDFSTDSATVSAVLTYKSLPLTATNYLASSVSSFAAPTSSNAIAANKDSITNSGVDTISYQVIGSHYAISVQPVITKVSGTLLAGSQLQYSEDGINFFNVAGDSLHCTNSSTPFSAIWSVPATTAQHEWYRVLTTGYGTTQKATVKLSILGK